MATAKKKPAKKKATVKTGVKAKVNRAQAMAPLVIAGMEDGMSLRESCEKNAVAPSSFMRWVEEDAALAEHYTRARARLLDLKAEELEDIGERAATAETAVEVAGLRLLSDNRKWLLSKLAPKKYGDKLALGGDDALGPLTVVVRKYGE